VNHRLLKSAFNTTWSFKETLSRIKYYTYLNNAALPYLLCLTYNQNSFNLHMYVHTGTQKNKLFRILSHDL
jgi:hypothetical protein